MSAVTNTTPQNGDSTETLLKKILTLMATSSGGGTWGSITGTITEQLDLVAYVAAQILAAIGTVAIPKPAVDATLNPNYPASNVNEFFFISGAGKIGGASGISVEIGDMVYCTQTNAGGTQAAVGSKFSILQTNIPGLTTIGLALATLTNPSAVTFPRFNADNTATALTAADFLTAIGASPLTLVGSPFPPIQVACSDESTAITAGTGKVTFRAKFAGTITAVTADLTTAQASGSLFTVNIKKNGVTILSTNITIDNTSTTSVGAATPAVISVPSFVYNDVFTVDVVQIGTSGATGLKVALMGTRA